MISKSMLAGLHMLKHRNLSRVVVSRFATNPFNNPYGDKSNKITKNVKTSPTDNIGVGNRNVSKSSEPSPNSPHKSVFDEQVKNDVNDVLHEAAKENNNQVKAGQFVVNNIGLKHFINKVYQATGLGFAASLAAAYIGTTIPLLMQMPEVTIFGGGVASLVAFFGVQLMKPTTITQNVLGSPGQTITRTQNSISRIILYSIGAMGLGLTATPLFAAIHLAMPEVIPTSIALTLGIFGGASAVAYALPKDSALGYGKVLGGSLAGLIVMQLIGLGSYYFMGANPLSQLLYNIDNYVGIALFLGFIGYDTHVAIKQYESGNADHLGVSVQLFMDLWNLLIRIMQLLATHRQKK